MMPWQALIYAPLIGYGDFVAPRGQPTKEIINWSFSFQNDQRFIYHKLMPMNLDYFAVELAWYIKADKNDVSITEHAGIWKDMLNVDGTLSSNYGYLLWGYDKAPLKWVVAELKRDPDSRRAIAHINRPRHFRPGVRDIPCTMYFQFLLRKNKLQTIVHMRSQDAMFGLRNDLPFFWFVADVVATLLNKETSVLHLTVGSFHVYERHWEKVKAVVKHPGDWQIPTIDWSEEVALVVSKLTT